MDSICNDNIIETMEYSLRSLCFSIKRKGREILCDYNITPPQFDALQCIIYNKEVTLGDLSSKLFLAPSTITDLIDRMEKNQLVYREKDSKDRRIVKIKPLPKATEILDAVVKKRGEFLLEALKPFSEEELTLFKSFIVTLDNECEKLYYK